MLSVKTIRSSNVFFPLSTQKWLKFKLCNLWSILSYLGKKSVLKYSKRLTFFWFCNYFLILSPFILNMKELSRTVFELGVFSCDEQLKRRVEVTKNFLLSHTLNIGNLLVISKEKIKIAEKLGPWRGK